MSKPIPWWAVSILDLEPHTDHKRVRHLVQRGYGSKVSQIPAATRIWEEIVADARSLATQTSIADWIKHDPDRARRGALSSARAFVQWVDLKDDTLRVPDLKDFHVRGVRAMREQDLVEILWPFSHGKSWSSSMLVPLMDWAENPEFTEGRIYYNDKFAAYYVRKLMSEIERNAQLQALFPWIRRPIKPNLRRGVVGDPGYQYWSTKAFCIGGKQVVEPSFEPLTVSAGVTGRRYWRTGVDDWVNSDNAGSELIQDRMWDYFHTGPMTMRRVVPFHSQHYTKAGTLFVVGTLFDRRDINYRLMADWRKQGRLVQRVDIYPRNDSRDKGETIWPEERDFQWALQMEAELGLKGFNLRCRNRVFDDGEQRFTEEDVDRAIRDDLRYGEVPHDCTTLLIGFDPATGKRTRYSKYPAAAMLGFKDDYVHVICWGRWSFPMPRQIDMLADWAHTYQCPVAVEDASQQVSYQDWMRQRYPDVRVICHTTSNNKRDWNDGVESFVPLFETRRVLIHTGGADPSNVRALREELVSYPQGRFTDLVMAMWTAKHQHHLRTQAMATRVVTEGVPAYVRHGGGVVIDLAELRRRVSVA